MSRILYFLLLILMGYLIQRAIRIYRRRYLVQKREQRWRRLATQNPIFAKTYEIRKNIISLIAREEWSESLSELHTEVDALVAQIMTRVQGIVELDSHLQRLSLRDYDAQHAQLREQQATTRDEQARRIMDDSLAKLEQQQKRLEAVQARREVGLAALTNTNLELESVYMDLVGALSSAQHSELEEALPSRERVALLREELEGRALVADAYLELLYQDEEELTSPGISRAGRSSSPGALPPPGASRRELPESASFEDHQQAKPDDRGDLS